MSEAMTRALAVDAKLVIAVHLPDGASVPPRPLPVLTPRPVRIYDPGECTVQAILDHAAWLTEALVAKVAAIRLGRGGDSMLVRVARKAIPRGDRSR